jgi:hypothetical protein
MYDLDKVSLLDRPRMNPGYQPLLHELMSTTSLVLHNSTWVKTHLEIRQGLGHLGELPSEGLILHQILHRVQSGIDSRDVAQGAGEPDPEESFTCTV